MARSRTVTETYPRGQRSAAGASVPGLAIPEHDAIEMEYSGTNLTGVKYFATAAEPVGKDLVAQLALEYDAGGNLVKVSRVEV